jgi:hypothetical protein
VTINSDKSESFLPQLPTAQLNLAELMAETVTPPVITQEVKVIKKQTAEIKPTGRHALPAHRIAKRPTLETTRRLFQGLPSISLPAEIHFPFDSLIVQGPDNSDEVKYYVINN